MWALASSLTYNKSLRHLDVSDNRHVTAKGIQGAILDNIDNILGLEDFQFAWYNSQDMIQCAKCIASGMEKNFSLSSISCMTNLGPSERFYLDLNRNGRRLLYHHDTIPLSVWPLILGRMTSANTCHLLYYFLREKADLLASSRSSQDVVQHTKEPVNASNSIVGVRGKKSSRKRKHR